MPTLIPYELQISSIWQLRFRSALLLKSEAWRATKTLEIASFLVGHFAWTRQESYQWAKLVSSQRVTVIRTNIRPTWCRGYGSCGTKRETVDSEADSFFFFFFFSKQTVCFAEISGASSGQSPIKVKSRRNNLNHFGECEMPDQLKVSRVLCIFFSNLTL